MVQKLVRIAVLATQDRGRTEELLPALPTMSTLRSPVDTNNMDPVNIKKHKKTQNYLRPLPKENSVKNAHTYL